MTIEESGPYAFDVSHRSTWPPLCLTISFPPLRPAATKYTQYEGYLWPPRVFVVRPELITPSPQQCIVHDYKVRLEDVKFLCCPNSMF